MRWGRRIRVGTISPVTNQTGVWFALLGNR